MDIVCPNCAATYRVPEALLAQGKPLRCAACGETWVPETRPEPAAAAEPSVVAAEPPVAVKSPAQEAPRDEVPVEPAGPPRESPADLPAPGPEPAAGPPPARPAPPLTPPPLNPPVLQRRPVPATGRHAGLALRLAWAASIAMVLLALAGLVLYGDAIAAAWPPFARVTALIAG